MKKNKGFTLVEIIVILVILAILAAVLIPSLTHYIDKAKEKQIASEARSALMATQTALSETYAKYSNVKVTGSGDSLKVVYSTDGGKTWTSEAYTADTIMELAELLGSDKKPIGEITVTLEKDDGTTCEIKNFSYKNKASGKTIIHAKDGNWSMS